MLGIYLDYNATAPLRHEVRDAMIAVMDEPFNPSSVHGFGQRARALVDEAREAVAARVGAAPEEVIFTSGGTEANALALNGDFPAVAITMIEHAAVQENAQQAFRIQVDGQGVVDLNALETWLKTAATGALVVVMLANNETGVIQPVAEVVNLAKQYGAIVHCDAVQALGKWDFNFSTLGVDSMALSAHKIGGSAGTGALLVKKGAAITPLMYGGGQERSRRAGTENIIGIVGFGAAVQIANPAVFENHCRPLQQRLEATIMDVAPDAVIFSTGTERLANTTLVAMPGRESETQVMAFDLAGIAVSAGAACSSGKVKRSHVLEAMGAGVLASSSIRISSGWDSTPSDVDRLAEAWLALYKQA